MFYMYEILYSQNYNKKESIRFIYIDRNHNYYK